MAALLHGVRPTDPQTFAIIAVSLGVVAIGASVIPAVRATRVDPLGAIRAE
jgi:ABC-type lipoprotein release transport system permease subunit